MRKRKRSRKRPHVIDFRCRPVRPDLVGLRSMPMAAAGAARHTEPAWRVRPRDAPQCEAVISARLRPALNTSEYASHRMSMRARNALSSAESGVCRSIPTSSWVTQIIRSRAAWAADQELRSARRSAATRARICRCLVTLRSGLDGRCVRPRDRLLRTRLLRVLQFSGGWELQLTNDVPFEAGDQIEAYTECPM
jgi:hypothetical protein